MKIGISALKFNLEDALNICKKNKKGTFFLQEILYFFCSIFAQKKDGKAVLELL